MAAPPPPSSLQPTATTENVGGLEQANVGATNRDVGTGSTDQRPANTPKNPQDGQGVTPGATQSKYNQLPDEDVDMGNTSDQPPNDWPPGRDDNWKSQHSPLTWPFTEVQNKRKLMWLQYLVDANPTKMTPEKLVGSLVTSEIIRQEWYENAELKRRPKISDVNYLLHPDKAIASFQNKEHNYNQSWAEIEALHHRAFASTLASFRN
jgi:hypothetical protein